jgi:hypothetical protein
MVTSDERMKILKMVEDGKITADEGARLLSALAKQKLQQTIKTGDARWLRVRITDLRTGKESVKVNLPIDLVNVGLRMGARFVPSIEQEYAMEEMIDALNQGLTGKVVEFVDEDDGQRVELFIE